MQIHFSFPPNSSIFNGKFHKNFCLKPNFHLVKLISSSSAMRTVFFVIFSPSNPYLCNGFALDKLPQYDVIIPDSNLCLFLQVPTDMIHTRTKIYVTSFSRTVLFFAKLYGTDNTGPSWYAHFFSLTVHVFIVVIGYILIHRYFRLNGVHFPENNGFLRPTRSYYVSQNRGL